jgi:hypothetical protein
VQNSYGGCPNDVCWTVIDVEPTEGCTWETSMQALNTSGSGRVFLYALNNTRQNWNNNGIVNNPDDVGSAAVFAITVTTASSVPEPATLLSFGAALAALGFIRRKRS